MKMYLMYLSSDKLAGIMELSNLQATFVSPKSLSLLFEVPQVFFCAFFIPLHIVSQEPHLPWAAASDTGDHWTSRHPAWTSDSGKKEMVWNGLKQHWWIWSDLIRHDGLRGFEWQDFRAFTDPLVPFSSTKKALRTRRCKKITKM